MKIELNKKEIHMIHSSLLNQCCVVEENMITDRGLKELTALKDKFYGIINNKSNKR